MKLIMNWNIKHLFRPAAFFIISSYIMKGIKSTLAIEITMVILPLKALAFHGFKIWAKKKVLSIFYLNCSIPAEQQNRFYFLTPSLLVFCF